MTDIFDRIWEAALPFQDKRDDAGHAEVTYGFARRLVELDRGDPEVVLPAIILHDTGWSRLTREERFVIFSPTATKEDELRVRHRHQEEGVNIAREVLAALGYAPEPTREILEIISQHDTRPGFLSLNDGLVRDADKLWRFSRTGFEADVIRFGVHPARLHHRIYEQIPGEGFFYSETSRELAREELDQRKAEYGSYFAEEAPEAGVATEACGEAEVRSGRVA